MNTPRVIASLALAAALAGCKVGLYSGLNEQEANDIVGALVAERLDAGKERLENNEWQGHGDEGPLAPPPGALRAPGPPRARALHTGGVFPKHGRGSPPPP